MLKYAEKVYGLCTGLWSVQDGRVKPRIPAGRAALSYVLLLLARLGSLNALEQRAPSPAWEKLGRFPISGLLGGIDTTAGNREASHFFLLLFIAYNLFHAFLDRNLKPQARAGRSEKYWADLIAAEFVVLFHRSPKPT